MVVYNGPIYSSSQRAAKVAPLLGKETESYEDEGVLDTVVRHAKALEAHFAEDNLIHDAIENVYLLGERLGEQTAMLMTGQRYDIDFNPFDYVTEPIYYDYADRFTDCNTKQQVDLMKMRINRELKHKNDMSKVGMGANLVYGFLANAADPTNFVPFEKMGTFIKGKGLLAGATRGAVVAGASNAVQELFLKELSTTYTDEEFKQNLLIGTAIGGGLGGIIGKFGKQAAIDTLDVQRKDIFDKKLIDEKTKIVSDLNKKGTIKNLDNEDLYGRGASIGAAETPSYLINQPKSGGVLADKLLGVQRHLEPLTFLQTSSNIEVRNVSSELGSISVIKSDQIVDTVEAVKKQNTDDASIILHNSNDNYLRYYYDKDDITLKDRVRRYLPTKLGGLNPEMTGKMSPTKWNESITECIESGFKKHSDNKLLLESAKEIDSFMKKNAEYIERLNKEGKLSVGVVKNYMHRTFNVAKVAENANAFVEALVNRYRVLREYQTKDLPKDKVKLEQNQKNLKIGEEEVLSYRARLKELSSDIWKKRKTKYEKEGAIHQAEKDLDRAIRTHDKTNQEVLKVSPDLNYKPGDKEFARHIKYGLPENVKPKTLSDTLRELGILIDDIGGDLGKGNQLTLQGYTGKDIESLDVRSPDSLGELLWNLGWYRERPDVDDVLSDIRADYEGILPKYHEDDFAALRREHDINEAKETLERLGYNWTKMSPEQIDNVLSNIGDKALIKHKQAKAKEQILSKLSGKEKAAINKKIEELEFLRKERDALEEDINNLKGEQSSIRANRDNVILDNKAAKSNIKKLTIAIQKAEKLLNATDDDLRKMAYEERDRLNSGTSGDNFNDDLKETSALLSRDLLAGDLPDELSVFLEKDATLLMNSARKEFVDLTLIDRFGSVGLTEQKNRIKNSFNLAEKRLGIMKEKGADTVYINKQLKKLQNEKKDVEKNLDLIINRIRERNYTNKGVSETTETILTGLKSWNVLTDLPQIVVSSLPDIGSVMAKTSAKHTAKSFSKVKEFASLSVQEQLKKYPWLSHAIVETFNNARGLSFAELTNNSPFENRAMRISRGSVDVAMNAFGATLWNKYGKVLAGFSHISYLQEIAEAHRKGAMTEKMREYAGRYGLSPRDIHKMGVYFKRYGSKSDDGGITVPNFMTWKDQELAKTLKYGVDKVMDEAIVTPGLNKAAAFENPYLSVVLQYKTFAAAAVGATLIPGMQSADKSNVLVGMSTMVGLGMLSVMAKNALAGRDPLEPGEVFMRGFAASGVAGWIEEPYKLVNLATRGGLDKMWYAVSGGYLGSDAYSPYQFNRDMESFLGSSYGKFKNTLSVIGDVSSGEIDADTMRKFKRLIIMQNFYGINYALNTMINNLSEE